jgi:lipoyl(octanoyl) transferase
MSIWQRIDFLGPVRPSYSQIWDLQKKRVDEVAAGSAREAVFFCEHEPVITTGRRTQVGNILDPQSVPVVPIERGGDATWHGPGQLVVYPILKLNGGILRFGLHDYLRFAEEAIIQSFADLGLETGRYGPTGVWVRKSSGDAKKIASIGVAVRRWITYHGMAINLKNDFEGFEKIRPCNFDSQVMTSAQQEGLKIELRDFADLLEIKMMSLLGISSLMDQVENSLDPSSRQQKSLSGL